jgi:hypothetical protein
MRASACATGKPGIARVTAITQVTATAATVRATPVATAGRATPVAANAPNTGPQQVSGAGSAPVAGTTASGAAVPVVRRTGFSIARDGSYAACLAHAGNGWFPERWTLDSTEPYTVPLPVDQPEEPGTEVVPLSDGRVLIRRRAAGHHDLALLYPTGPGTGQLRLGSLRGPEVRLLPSPLAPGSRAALATAYDGVVTEVWLVHGDGGPRELAAVPGRCTGGAWLDRTGRILALDRTDPDTGRTKAVAIDLRTGEFSPLLQITEQSDDRLLLADPDSGLLIVRSDAPGEPLLGWGVLGSQRPVRFPECLRVPGALLLPFAAQPGQTLTPEQCAVALSVTGAHGTSLAVWRPRDRRAVWLSAPEGWLPGAGVWTARGVLRLPYACAHCSCGVVEYDAPPAQPGGPEAEPPRLPRPVTAAVQPGSGVEPHPGAVLPLQKAPLAPLTSVAPPSVAGVASVTAES